MKSSQIGFSLLFSCSYSHFLKEEVRKIVRLSLFFNLVRLLELLEVQCIGALIVASTFCLFTNLLNHASTLADCTRAIFLWRIFLSVVLLYVENT